MPGVGAGGSGEEEGSSLPLAARCSSTVAGVPLALGGARGGVLQGGEEGGLGAEGGEVAQHPRLAAGREGRGDGPRRGAGEAVPPCGDDGGGRWRREGSAACHVPTVGLARDTACREQRWKARKPAIARVRGRQGREAVQAAFDHTQ